MSWKGKERFSLLKEGAAGSVFTYIKDYWVRKTYTEVSPTLVLILKDPILHKIFSGLRRPINGHLSW